MAPFIVSFLLLAVGAGIIKPNVAPTVLDQYSHQKPYTKVLQSGERVVVDPGTTVQRLMLIFYGLVNVGAFFLLATTYTEKYVGYWLAFLLPGIVYFLLPALLWYLNNKLIKVYNVLKTAVSQSKGAVWKKGFLDAAKPSTLSSKGFAQVSWTDKDVDDIKRTFIACGAFLYFPVYNINDSGIGSVATSQGATMTTNGAPNDLLNNFNPLTIIVFVPILSHVVYAALRKFHIKFSRISRITFGFCLAILSGLFGSLVQWKIYQLSPCGNQATSCADVAPISIWWQVPNVSFGVLSDCFCNVTAYELAYARAPQGMKALVMSLFLFTTALSSAVGETISPAIADPHLVWVWGGPTIALTVQTVIFWFRYRDYNEVEFMLEDEPGPALDEKIFGDPDYPATADPEAVKIPKTIDEEEGPKSESPVEKV